MKTDMKPPEHVEKYVKLGTALSINTQLFSTRMGQMLDRFGLTEAQFSVLNHLAQRMPEGQSVTAIAAAVEVKQPAVSKMVTKFEGMGWARFESIKGDARAKQVLLTEAGIAHLMTVQRALLPDYVQMLEGWSDEDIASLTAQLFRLVGWLDQNRL
ncbi:DNA-binding MarR family transcriptional regulator [Planktotalea frisia]|uniref:Transcriptional regulator SlyA n=1 Tax=Planktotalea frisia TaxID=696762 RepID=A0A1L9NYF0_9RHOB|nr:MarR family transcriptional regulator [Planktotalea frisia]OJI94287.1 transcriptional regulator SlyA [Planktotalea frisia]PZX29943.1 DNA-binding MarR family transcriptional regulator [Planktotalea frisia]